MRNAIIKVWRGESKSLKWFLYPLLFPLSCAYEICLYVRNIVYRSGLVEICKVPIPVISIGNITLGGTGKTPVVGRVSERLRRAGLNPAIITRGYKRKRKGTFLVDRDNDSAVDVGDEALMLSKKTRLPVFVGANRAQAIMKGIDAYPIDIALLDDGFQLRNLYKDIEILLIDCSEKNNTSLFPLGPFRERAKRIKDADIILTRNGSISGLFSKYAEGVPAFSFRYRPMYLCNLRHDLTGHYNFLKEKNVLAFSGLGNNKSFFDLLKDLGANVVHEVSYPDHYLYKNSDIKTLSGYHDADIIVTTEKDATKINQSSAPENLYYLTVEVEIENEDAMIETIMDKLSVVRKDVLERYDGEIFYN
ncbi:MAG TPA: tetraacyldisaccharide 4'-kinase [Syntrophorhabdaceae bacterium]|jgi:tetraacyldisaccharide 4'-kinase|nr:tetraacyldisaccharide 4'-kinase [Syntrophorhabdaceae bacterium]HOF57190.1 tetraacyldisaccharide 4'-kinase [Syntrophorhabdaceae bacterium]HOS04769.1 tetraacyldisaccharide 4'-kinase [Syntrophorhabdaceae bacterium]HPL40489.1 tetraacyldisaccharide 4'-kinase [Syntrophorhabdaceae bacterium]